MDNLSLFILIIIILLLFYITTSNNSCKRRERLENNNKLETNDKIDEVDEFDDEILNKAINASINTNIKSNVNNTAQINVLPYFVEMQFHNDYKDVISAFDIMIETGRQIFNRSNLPVSIKELNSADSIKMTNVFIEQLNDVLKRRINNHADVENGWKNIQENKQIESGWEKQMKKIGVPSNIYDKGALKSKIILIRIDKFVMSTTDSQTRYDVFMIIQKDNSYDQMVLKVSFVTDREDMNTDRNFFKDDKTVDLNVHMEDIFVIGFMTNHSYGSNNVSMRQDFYNFENVEKDGMMDQTEIMKQLKKKYTQYQIESNGLTIQMDPVSGNNLALERINKKLPIGPFESTNN
jgi:hypothetical protein